MNSSINSKIFDHINSSPKYFSDGGLTFLYRSCENNHLGFILPKHLGAAHKRNKFKRRCRSLFQLINKKNSSLKLGIIIKTRTIDSSYKNINRAFINFDNSISQ